MSAIKLNVKQGLQDLPDYRAGRTRQAVLAERHSGSDENRHSATPPSTAANNSAGLELAALASNEAAYDALPSVVEALNKLEIRRYPEVRSDRLVSAIARFHNVSPERVAVGAGSAGLMWQFAEAFLSQTSTVAAPAPSFEGYGLVTTLAGATFLPIPLRDYTADVDLLTTTIDGGIDVLFLAEPNNPTGTSIGFDGLRRLIDHTRDRCFLVVDEAYAQFNAGQNAADAITMAKDEPHVLVLRTFSKAYGLASLRVGYAIGDPEVCRYLNRVAPPFSVNGPAQQAAIASLAAKHELAVRVAKTIEERCHLEDEIRRRGIEVTASETNFVFIPVDEPERVAAHLENNGVITRPVAGHGIRVTVGLPAENRLFLSALDATAATGLMIRSQQHGAKR